MFSRQRGVDRVPLVVNMTKRLNKTRSTIIWTCWLMTPLFIKKHFYIEGCYMIMDMHMHMNTSFLPHLFGYQLPASNPRSFLPHLCGYHLPTPPYELKLILSTNFPLIHFFIYSFCSNTYHIRPHQAASSGSRPISTENLFRGQLVVGWVTTSEYWLLYVFVSLYSFCFFFVFLSCYT